MSRVDLSKVIVHATLVKLLFHQRTDRGMTLIAEQSRCVRAGEIHELLTTDQDGLAAGSRLDRVGFLGFVEVCNAGVLDVGDTVTCGDVRLGVVAGFDACHFPNHYNIVLRAERLVTAGDLALPVGRRIEFQQGTLSAETGHLR
ncbi:MAG: hypothetical protein GEU83_07935 [Pseudonocardiaceae bacterium]|nr:hypothetical protein [Pseudonocardiaceae bacterium]